MYFQDWGGGNSMKFNVFLVYGLLYKNSACHSIWNNNTLLQMIIFNNRGYTKVWGKGCDNSLKKISHALYH